jgi:hypothetical protein
MNAEYKSYVERLNWFKDNKGLKQDKKLEPLEGEYPLVSAAKGIYKPKDIKFVLSIKITDSGKYTDGEFFSILGNGKAFYYELEKNKNIANSYSNAALIENIKHSVPVGVVKIIKQGSKSEYVVHGCFYPIIMFKDRILLCDMKTFKDFSKQEIKNSCFEESRKLNLLGISIE